MDEMDGIIANYKNSKMLDLTGAIFEYDLNYFRLSAEVIKQGKRTGVTASLHNLPIAQTNVSGKVAMGYYDTGAPDANGCQKLWYCEGQYNGITCYNQGYIDGSCYPGSNPNGSDSGYDSSSAYQSGGSPYGGNSTPPSLNPEDPCAKAKILAGSTVFNNSMTSLKDGLTNQYETDIIFQNDGTTTSINNGPGGLDDKITTTQLNTSSGLAHNHENDHGTIKNLSIFSSNDVQAMFLAMQATIQGYKAPYTFSLVTLAGSYILSINDFSKFQTFGADNLNDAFSFNIFSNFYSNYIKLTNSPAQNEVNMQTLLNTYSGGTGLTLMKNTGTSSTAVWKKVEKDSNGLVTYVGCPN